MRISSGTLVLGVFAAMFGLVGAYAAKQYLAEKPVEQPPAVGVTRISVPMAAVDLPAGRTIATADIMVRQLTWEQIQAEGLPVGFMDKVSQLAGRTLRTSIAKGTPFTPEDLFPEGTGPSVAERLKPGYRAVSVPLDNSNAEMALLSPGSVVDVMFRTFANRGVPETTVTLLESVELLAIGEQTFPGGRVNAANNNGRQSASVTLACTPDQASALKVIEGRGSLSLVLRGPDDNLLVGNTPPQTLESLLDLPAPKPAVTTQIFRRGHLTTAVFEDGKNVSIAQGFTGLPIAADTTKSNSVMPVSYVRTAAENTAVAAASDGTGCKTCGKDK